MGQILMLYKSSMGIQHGLEPMLAVLIVQMPVSILGLPHNVGGQKYIPLWLLSQLTAWFPIKKYSFSDPELGTSRLSYCK